MLDGVVFRTKPELAPEMLAGAVAEGTPVRRVGGDSVYGDSPTFARGVRLLGKWYVVDTSADAHIWAEEPEVVPAPPRPAGRPGRPASRPNVVGVKRPVTAVAAALPESAWKRVTVAEGSRGPPVYDYAELWVWFGEEGLPGPKERLPVRRSIGQEPESKYHRYNAPSEVKLAKPAAVRATRRSARRGGRSRRTSNRARASAGRTSTRRAGGWGGTTPPPCRCWPWRSWC